MRLSDLLCEDCSIGTLAVALNLRPEAIRTTVPSVGDLRQDDARRTIEQMGWSIRDLTSKLAMIAQRSQYGEIIHYRRNLKEVMPLLGQFRSYLVWLRRTVIAVVGGRPNRWDRTFANQPVRAVWELIPHARVMEGYVDDIRRVQTYLDKRHIPKIEQGLAAEAKKCSSFEEFQSDFLGQIKHGMYFHWTNDPHFEIDPRKGPRDMSRMGRGTLTPGALMITRYLDEWKGYGNRQWVAIIDMSDVARDDYYQVRRGFGNEFFVRNPSRARISAVLTPKQAEALDRRHRQLLPQNAQQLRQFYNIATE